MDLIRTEQKREMGELMKGFVDKTLDFYETIKDREDGAGHGRGGPRPPEKPGHPPPRDAR